jgi:two-component system cell cycle response regulator
MVGVPDLHVLIADPDAERRGLAAAVLAAVGSRVTEVGSARAAVDACRAEPPTVLLVDEDACRADDLRIIDAIKRDPELFGVGVVVRARRLDVDDALDGMARGAQGVLIDPVADAELVATVRGAARTGMLQEELRTRAVALEELAFTDALSGIPNRRFIDRQLEALISSARRHGRPLALALIDIDRFKPVNDTHGHAVGDAVITEVAGRLASRLRAEDHLGRFGGEEFLVLLPDTVAEAAAAVAEDLRRSVDATPVETSAGPLDVSVSVGWASWDDEAAHELIARADEALYQAKQRGRNRVIGAPIEVRTSR